MDKQSVQPFGQYCYVDVVFPPAANTDHVISYTNMTPENRQSVRWQDVTPNDSGGAVATVYQSSSASRKLFGVGYVVLRCTVANYATRLLLFTERVEGR